MTISYYTTYTAVVPPYDQGDPTISIPGLTGVLDDNGNPVTERTVAIRALPVKIPGASSPNGDVLYSSRNYGNIATSIRHVVEGENTPLSVSVQGNYLLDSIVYITVNLATDMWGRTLSTAADVVAAVNASAAAGILVKASLPGDGTWLAMAADYMTIQPGVLWGGAYARGALAAQPNGDILYALVYAGDNRQTFRIHQLVTGLPGTPQPNIPRSIQVLNAEDVRVTLATDANGAIASTETAASIAAYVNAFPAAAAIVKAIPQGDGSALVAPFYNPTSVTVISDSLGGELVQIPGFTQVSNSGVQPGQFLVYYDQGLIVFNSADTGKIFTVTYLYTQD